MSSYRQIFAFSRAEIFALVLLLSLLLIGGGILLYRKSTQSLPPELFFETIGVEERSRSPLSTRTTGRRYLLVELENRKVNLNTAPAESLSLVPQIGPVIPQRIIDFRDQLGMFDSVGQLIEVNGVGSKKLAAMRKYLTVK